MTMSTSAPLTARGVALVLLVLATLLTHTTAQPSRRRGPALVAPPRRGPRRSGITAGPKGTAVCDAPIRTLDGTCTSEVDSELGGTNRAQFSYGLTSDATTPRGGNNPSSLPSARLVSNVVSAQAGNVFSRRRLNEMVTFIGQFLDHSIISTPVAAGKRFDIPIPRTDPIFSNFSGGMLRLERSIRWRDARRRQRPINELSSAVDLTTVYGPEEDRLKELRSFQYGLMKTSAGNKLPLNTAGIENSPSKSRAFFVAGDRRVNENPVLTSLHTLFLREHNRLARDLRRKYPYWDDEKLFQDARLLNTATFQKVIFDEFFPAMTGRALPRYRGYRRNVDPAISDVFGAAAFRIGHTMVGNQINLRGAGNVRLRPIKFRDMFFRRNNVLDNGIEPFLRGAIHEPSQEVDVKIMNSLRNFLFTNVRNEIGFDLMALNIQRGRDHTIPAYNDLRVLFGGRRAKSYREITRNRAVQTALASAYGSIDKIDAIVGMFAEDHVRGASMGITMLRIWQREFTRMRDGDRFFFLRNSMYPRDLWRGYRKEITTIQKEQNTFKNLILRNTKISSRDLRGSVWKAKKAKGGY